MAMLMSMLQTNPQLMQQMGKAFQQIAVEMKRREKYEQLEVCFGPWLSLSFSDK
jgi:hypothetical protein